MKKRKWIIVIILLAGIIFFTSCNLQSTDSDKHNQTILRAKKPESIGMPNPAAVYCIKLGYRYKIITDDKGGQHGVCIFSDNNECNAWDFYRGKTGQEWSYCTQCGYDLKDLGPHEGWIKGAVCIDNETKEEIGTIYDLTDISSDYSLPKR